MHSCTEGGIPSEIENAITLLADRNSYVFPGQCMQLSFQVLLVISSLLTTSIPILRTMVAT